MVIIMASHTTVSVFIIYILKSICWSFVACCSQGAVSQRGELVLAILESFHSKTKTHRGGLISLDFRLGRTFIKYIITVNWFFLIRQLQPGPRLPTGLPQCWDWEGLGRDIGENLQCQPGPGGGRRTRRWGWGTAGSEWEPGPHHVLDNTQNSDNKCFLDNLIFKSIFTQLAGLSILRTGLNGK